MSTEFVHTHVHTEYSLLDGQSRIGRLVDEAENAKMRALAITDHGNMHGAIEFYKACRAKDIKPILGVEGYIVEDMAARSGRMGDYNHLLLFARDNEGYRNLMRLVTASYTRGYYYKPRMDRELLAQHASGLIATSGCLAGQIPELLLAGDESAAKKLVRWYQDVLGRENYYIELQDHIDTSPQRRLNEMLLDLARQTEAPILATNDLHYVREDDAIAHDTLLCIQMGKNIGDPNRMRFDGKEYYLKNAAQMEAVFGHLPEAMRNTLVLAEQCNVEIEFGRNLIPDFPPPPGFASAADYLYHLCEEGLRWRYGEITPTLRERLDYEFGVIRDKGFVPYFLIVWDYVNYARKNGMRCVARGSVAGSIIAYALGMANVDPIRYGIAFERFLNPERNAMPDIDIDFPDDRREEVVRYVAEKYGWDKVAQIATFNVLGAKSAVRDVGRVLDQRAAADVISRAMTGINSSIADALAASAELREMYRGDPVKKQILDMAQELEGHVRNTGIHAAGVVISREPLVESTPLFLRDNKDPQSWMVTQYPQAQLEELGLLKMDFLGLSNLTILQDAVELIARTRGVTVDIDKIPLDDADAFKLLASGETTAIFQLESPAMRMYIKELKPTRLEDIMAMVALYRPGPMDSIPRFIRAKHNPQETRYMHPLLEPILRSTYGVLVFQDQVLLTAINLAGFTWGEVDKFRKAMGKKLPEELIRYRDKFLKGCVARGIDHQTASDIFTLIEPFGGYGFNYAHAAAYGLVAYQTAYLKAHYPVEFLAATMSKEAGNKEKIALLVDECRRMSIPVLGPHINHSAAGFTPEHGAIRFGFSAINGLGERFVTALIDERAANGDFRSVTDVFRTPRITKSVVEALVRSGAFDDYGDRSALLAMAMEAAKHRKSKKTTLATVPSGLAATTKTQKLVWEYETLGVYLSGHPLEEVSAALRSRVTHQTGDLSEEIDTQKVTVGGRLLGVHKMTTRKGAAMATAVLEDLQGTIDVVAFPGTFERVTGFWKDENIVLLTGQYRYRDGEPQIVVDRAELFDGEAALESEAAPEEPESSRLVHITIPATAKPTIVAHIQAIIAEFPGSDPYEAVKMFGDAPVRFSSTAQTKKRVEFCPAFAERVTALLGTGSVTVKE